MGVDGGPVGVAVVGCGTISDQYLTNLLAFPDVAVRALADIDVERAKEKAAQYDVPNSGEVESVLARDDVDLVVNLTIPAAHVVVATAALRAGKHVYSEKPLTLDRAAGQQLLAEAAERGLRVGNAPDTFLGAGLQTCQRLLATGIIGEPQSARTIFQTPGPESWHPSPEFLFQVGGGPLLDVGPYYFTTLVQMLGSFSRVAAFGRRAKDQRVIGSGPKAGTVFDVEVPTDVSVIAEFAGGQTASMGLSFDAPRHFVGYVEIAGSEGTMRLPDPNQFGGPVRIWKQGAKDWDELPVEGTTVSRGIGVAEMVQAILEDRPHRASGELAMHVFDVMAAVGESIDRGEIVEAVTQCERPEPLNPAWDPTAA